MTPSEDGAETRSRGAGGARRREEKKVLSRQKILDAARAIFFRDGFMAANLDEVAQTAGVAKGTLYRYFDSKAELYVAVLAQNGAIFKERMRETVSGTLRPAEQIRRVSKFYFDHWTQHHDYFQIFWAIENQAVIGDLPPGVLEEVSNLWEECIEIVAGIVSAGVRSGDFTECDPWEVANILWTLSNGLIQTEASATRRSLRRGSLEQVFDDAIALCLRGLSA